MPRPPGPPTTYQYPQSTMNTPETLPIAQMPVTAVAEQQQLGDDDEREARQLGALCVCCAAHYVTCYVALHGGIRIILGLRCCRYYV